MTLVCTKGGEVYVISIVFPFLTKASILLRQHKCHNVTRKIVVVKNVNLKPNTGTGSVHLVRLLKIDETKQRVLSNYEVEESCILTYLRLLAPQVL